MYGCLLEYGASAKGFLSDISVDQIEIYALYT